jgi:putative hydrolase of HD superfamily
MNEQQAGQSPASTHVDAASADLLLESDKGIDPHAVVRLTFELSQCRKELRSGWRRIGVPLAEIETVADHSHRAAALGFVLASMEGFEHPELVSTMVTFHDVHEIRTGDRDAVHKKYGTPDEQRGLVDQLDGLGMAGFRIQQMWEEVEHGSSEAGIIAKDAEVLEMAFEARQLVLIGYKAAQLWIESVRDRLKTDSALQLLELLDTADPNQWWRELCEQ